MLGGGTFVARDKILPGSYINFVSAKNSAIVGARGTAALALPLSWGPDGEIFEVTADRFKKDCLALFGFTYDSEEARGLRDLFRHAKTAYCYKLMNGGGYASNAVARARYRGAAGARLSTEITEGDRQGTFDAVVRYGTKIVSSVRVSTLEELLAFDNGWVVWKPDTLAASPYTMLSGEEGEALDGAEITKAEYEAFLTASESYAFQAVGCISQEAEIKELFARQVRNMRENAGIKYQAVLYDCAADYEGVINVKNCAEAVYWTLGATAACPLNESNTNRTYDGEFSIPVNLSQTQLEAAVQTGGFVFHRAGKEIRVLEDINSLVTVTEEKKDDFKSNQTIRVIDQIAMDIAAIFSSKYSGKIPNDNAGRLSLWNDIVTHHKELETARAIEGFEAGKVSVEAGNTGKSVVITDQIQVVNAMSQLYMTVVVE